MNDQTAPSHSQSHGRVHLTLHGDIAVLTIDNPPVNALSHAIRLGLIDTLQRCEAVRGAILIGAGRTFIAGSDLREFGRPLAWPELPDVIAAIEAAAFPVVAAIHGVALGGGLELALGCDYRLAVADAKLGLPEVSLGMIPGAGGTQRLPRLVGRARAIDLICNSHRMSAIAAANIGLVDRVVSTDVLVEARAFLMEAVRPKRVVAALSVPPEPSADIDAAATAALKRGRNRPNVAEAIRLVKASNDPDVQKVLVDERETFQALRLSDEAIALRHLFFAERKAADIEGLDWAAQSPKVERIGIIGGGTMGQGIARACLGAGFPVILVERDAEAQDRALTAIRGALEARRERGQLSEAALAGQLGRLTATTELADLHGCDLVVEAVFEDMSVKKPLLRDLDVLLPPEVVIATNTSYLDINKMAEGLLYPERVLGLHFFSPADVMRLLEIVRAEQSSPAALATGLHLAKRLNKQPVVAQVADGFIGNRIYAAYRRRAELLVLDGAAPEAIDRAIEAFGFAMGPFAVSDMSGLDVAWAMRKRQAATRHPDARYVTIPDTLCESGRLGRKTGAGWYDYPEKRPVPSDEVASIIDAARQSAGITPVQPDDDTICRQLLVTMVNEAALLLEEGVAQRPGDVDVTMANGYGFPRWKGGPLWWAAQEKPADLARDLEHLAQAIGPGFRKGAVEKWLTELRKS